MKQQTKPSPQHLYGICPLCERAFTRVRLQAHIVHEPSRPRRQIISAIRSEHPFWAEAHGACADCWESFRGVAKVIEFMHAFTFPNLTKRPDKNGGEAGSEWKRYPLPRQKQDAA